MNLAMVAASVLDSASACILLTLERCFSSSCMASSWLSSAMKRRRRAEGYACVKERGKKVLSILTRSTTSVLSRMFSFRPFSTPRPFPHPKVNNSGRELSTGSEARYQATTLRNSPDFSRWIEWPGSTVLRLLGYIFTANRQLTFRGTPLSLPPFLPSPVLKRKRRQRHNVVPAAGKPLYEAQYSDFLRRKNTGLREFWRNWRNCARICACVDACAKKLRQNCAKIASFSLYCVNFPTFSKIDWIAQLIE